MANTPKDLEAAKVHQTADGVAVIQMSGAKGGLALSKDRNRAVVFRPEGMQCFVDLNQLVASNRTDPGATATDKAISLLMDTGIAADTALRNLSLSKAGAIKTVRKTIESGVADPKEFSTALKTVANPYAYTSVDANIINELCPAPSPTKPGGKKAK